jgi:L-alanine-DL-glutamate epimerase-like enolase superfamily enzyme
MPSIERIETIPIQLRPRRVSVMRGQAVMNTERLVVRVQADDGTVGWGEATAIAIWGGMRGRYYGETVATVGHVIHDVLTPLVLGGDPLAPTLLAASWDGAIVGHPYAKAALEMALQDIRGKVLGQPVVNLLGGAWRDGTRIAHMIGIMPDEEALAEADAAVTRDAITAFQVKGGEEAERDARVLRALRSALPDATFLRLDANQGFGADPKHAAAAVRRLEDAGADAVEQPASTIEAMAACAAAVAIPVIADEGCWQAYDVLELWRQRAADAVSVYVAKAGGMARALAVAATAEIVGWASDVNGSLETGIGTAASLHVAAASGSATLPSVVPIPSGLTSVAGRYFEDDVTSGFTFGDGVLALSGAPGLGITVDEERIRALAVGGARCSSLGGDD